MVIKRIIRRACRKVAYWRGDGRRVARWSNLMASDVVMKTLRTHFNPAIPPVVSVEINTDCNYKCPFCPQSSYQRPVRYITRQGFQHVVEDLKTLDYSGLFVLSVNNEPFLHPLLFDFCAIVSDELPKATACLISNGALIEEEHIIGLAKLARPPVLTIDDYTPDHRVSKRMREWLARAEAKTMSVKLEARSWGERISNRAGNQPGCTTVPADYRDIVCAWPFGGLFFNPELKAFLCCSDYRYEMMVGDLNRQSLMEIWNGDPLKRVRLAMLVPDRSQIPLCARCDAEWWCLPDHCM